MIYHNLEIARLIVRKMTQKATPDELQALKQWKEESPHNSALYARLISPENMRELSGMTGNYEKEEAWRKLRPYIIPKIRGRRAMKAVIAIAVATVALLLLLPYFFTMSGEQMIDITPGSFKAKIVREDGSTVVIDDTHRGLVIDGSNIAFEQETISYELPDEDIPHHNNSDTYHTLEVPKGGECRVKLSDGTIVCLNAMTRLRYPVKFTGDVRMVELAGESYFEVAPGEIPFVVRTVDMDVHVHGTSFNISVYEDNPTASVTLVSGALSVMTAHSEEVFLHPAQQVELERSTHNLTIRDIDPLLCTGWKEGLLRFKDCRLEDIMQTLSRWYDIEEIHYESEKIRDICFGLNLNRYEQLSPILEMLNRTGVVSARIDGRKIIFSE